MEKSVYRIKGLSMSNDYITNVPVAIIFFNRPDTLKRVFEAVRAVKPTKLFLIQDGAREGNKTDLTKIEECRKVVSNIDWNCDVVRDYSDINLGCGRRMFTGITNAFNIVDRLIIIEDDIVVSKDFFVFCEELLKKYKNDTRIHRISGMCHMGEYKLSPYSYAFTNISSCWGWATWKRSWNDMNYEMVFLDDEYTMRCFRKNYRYKKDSKELYKTGIRRRKILKNGGKLSAWTYQFSMGGRINNKLDISPCKNMITCIGLTEDSGHASGSINKIPKGLQPVFFGKQYKMDDPIKHPPYVMEDVEYENQIRKIMGWTPYLKVSRKIEGIIRQIIYGDLKKLVKKLFKGKKTI